MTKKIKITDKLIADLSSLAKLKFDKASAQTIKSELKLILGFVDTISRINVDKIEPLIYLNEELNILRNDTVKNEVLQKDALKNAPQKDSDYFKVPTVLKK